MWRCMRLYMHAPAKLRVHSEFTRWMDLLIHGPTRAIAEEGGIGPSPNWMKMMAGSSTHDRGVPSEH